MRAIVCPRYGGPDVLELREVEQPSPRDDEVCVRIMATAVTASDIFIRSSDVPLRVRIPMRLMLGITRPRRPIIGLVLAGEIASVGRNTTRFKPGDQVYGLTGYGLGAYAEYKCMKETDSKHGCLALKPANLTYEQATVAAYGGLLALQYMGRGDIQRGQRVLVYGASSTSGTTAVQWARHLGAEVTGVCGTANLELVKSLGADTVIDYTQVDALEPGDRYDFVLDAVGKARTSRLKESCRASVPGKDAYVSIDDGALKLDSRRLMTMKDLVEAGHITPVVDRCYVLEDMAEAHRYVGQGHKRGGVAVTVRRRQD